MTLVTHQAPDFTASAVLPDGTIQENFNFYQYSKNKMTVIFFWPLDFTFVCPSEIIAFNKYFQEFSKRKVNLLGISCDSQYTHHAWRNTKISDGGIGPVKFIMISDLKKDIQKKYNIEHPTLSVALRATFIIDTDGIIKHQTINDLPFGRNINEIIRIIDAIIYHNQHGEVCPAQWQKGKKGIIPTQQGIKNYLSSNLNDLK
ncbi:redoxin domain-containing protein [Enterobacteriaceae endosymbiont of Neohaemonia nigricornis]|uniref:redoxin domain-containing protein n=1 Tax=Enterobacteriaceae endosymbiont of Neohaemonia nigricornis TaxID=2675792 RepID=UPI001448EDB0|nr:redoxin domain-containing protein [Enterobacteriaceae endosymbiont of Neohaemonia nigricornis]QJC30357.1 redoxin domain-containing protein [Enterobacteriaceae endosymbiont of Neohaemonia nigricornis]